MKEQRIYKRHISFFFNIASGMALSALLIFSECCFGFMFSLFLEDLRINWQKISEI